jgi:transposase
MRTKYDTEGENRASGTSMWARRKLAARETHFSHTLTDTIITECVERGVGTLAVSWPEDVRESDWDTTGNKKLHTWAFDRISQYLECKGEMRGAEVLKKNEWNILKTCSRCGDDTKSNCKHRSLYVCQSCEVVGNADCNGAENMCQTIPPSPHGEERSTGCVAQSSTYLFDSDNGAFAQREQVVSGTVKYSPAGRKVPL